VAEFKVFPLDLAQSLLVPFEKKLDYRFVCHFRLLSVNGLRALHLPSTEKGRLGFSFFEKKFDFVGLHKNGGVVLCIATKRKRLLR
jgi:hypothetical protein